MDGFGIAVKMTAALLNSWLTTLVSEAGGQVHMEKAEELTGEATAPHEKEFQAKLKLVNLKGAGEEVEVIGEKAPTKAAAKRSAVFSALSQHLGVPRDLLDKAEADLAEATGPKAKKAKLTVEEAAAQLWAPDRNPVSFLHELATKASQTLDWELETEDGQPPKPGSDTKYKASVTVNKEQSFVAVHAAKKSAKFVAAVAALNGLYNLGLDAEALLASQTALPPAKKAAAPGPAGFDAAKFMRPLVEVRPPVQILHELVTKYRKDIKLEFIESPSEVSSIGIG